MMNLSTRNSVAFIIGNGESRKDINLKSLESSGVTFGCNAIYRDYEPDYLVAIDEKIIEEIRLSDFPTVRFIVPPESERWESAEYNEHVRKRSNAGMNAMLEAIKCGFVELYCLGFDFLIQDKELSTGNVYKDTECYGPETHCSYRDNDNRIDYLEWFCSKYYTVDFTFLFPDSYKNKIKKINNRSNNIYFAPYEE